MTTFDRIETATGARGNRVQVFAHAELEQAVFHQIFCAGYADARAEVTDGFRVPRRIPQMVGSNDRPSRARIRPSRVG